jgi:hypothetical protein
MMGYTETIKEINRGTLPAIMESTTANMVSEDSRVGSQWRDNPSYIAHAVNSSEKEWTWVEKDIKCCSACQASTRP